MQRLNRADRLISFLEMRWVECLACLYLLFLLQSTLVPFDFVLNRSDGSAYSLFVITTGWSYWPDTVSNIFLYFPFGVLLHWSIVRSSWRSSSAAIGVVLVALVVSLSTEWLQAYSPSRVSSLVDVAANLLGATLGASTSMVGGWSAPRLIGHLSNEARAHPGWAVLQTYCILLVVFSVMPFAILPDGPRLKQAFRNATVTPFAQSVAHARQAQAARDHGDEQAYALHRYKQMKLWTRWAAEFASFVVLAWLLHAVLFREYGFSHASTNALTWWLAGGLAVALSVLQLPVRSRGFHVTDILMRFTGVAVGVVTRWAFVERMARASQRTPAEHRAISLRLARLGCAAALLFILVRGLLPFVTDTREQLVVRALSAREFLPFFAYFHARFDLAMGDIMSKGAAYVVFAMLLALCWTRYHGRPLSVRLRAVMLVAAGISVPLEVAQIALRGRIPSLTDPIIAVIACACGVVLQDKLALFLRQATGIEAAQDAEAPTGHPPGWTITDELVASLIDSTAGAPIERPAGRQAVKQVPPAPDTPAASDGE